MPTFEGHIRFSAHVNQRAGQGSLWGPRKKLTITPGPPGISWAAPSRGASLAAAKTLRAFAVTDTVIAISPEPTGRERRMDPAGLGKRARERPALTTVLQGSHFTYCCPGRHSVVAPLQNGENFVTEKLQVLVRVDVDCARAQVAAQGHVTSQSVHGLYDVMKRANSLMAGLAMELDMTGARIEPDALEELRTCSRSHHLPVHIDPLQSDYRFSILAPNNAAHQAALVTQTA